ncbi:hypothetical protein OG320_01515 [Microbispora sp. NBC_01189]|uniref:hypothetical protein n=1 Tax=Microbispora sp. NBC_01189 TaxID=2903583 RepID=UPI002E14569F|nr:hypothetical protein OG320_01515 [Microbispora sp. NBC_01189]
MSGRGMTGVLGADPQRTRTALVLLETAGGATQTTPVGDGRRTLVPNAVRGASWGSAVAESSPDWPVDPWSEPFLRGLRDRATGYLGRQQPSHVSGYHVCLVGGPDAPETALAACAEADLPDVSLADPAEALVCRWLTEPGRTGSPSGTVLAVACGQAWTTAAAFEVDLTERLPSARRLTASGDAHAEGSDAWTGRLTATVLGRSREGLAPDTALAVEDGLFEFGALLRRCPDDQVVEWQGPLAGRLFAPFAASARELRAWDEVGRVTDAVTRLTHDVLGGATPVAVVVGGPGAVWPWVAEALRPLGPLWRSQEPEIDLAVGAAWWPWLRHRFDTAAETAALRLGHARRPAGEDPRRHLAVDPEPDEIPPWLR